MTEHHLPTAAIKADARLDAASTTSTEALAEHRWHWTLDETNPDRVSFSQYGRDVGRSFTAIAKHANAWNEYRLNSRVQTLADAMELVKLGADRREATEAVAAATGKSPATLRSGSNRQEVTSVLDTARERAERKGTPLADEIPIVAQHREAARKAQATSQAERQKRHTMRYLELEGDIASAKIKLTHVLKATAGHQLEPEETELLRTSIAALAALLNLIDLRLGGDTHTDWDAELAKISKDAS